jgi:hypothetical protein
MKRAEWEQSCQDLKQAIKDLRNKTRGGCPSGREDIDNVSLQWHADEEHGYTFNCWEQQIEQSSAAVLKRAAEIKEALDKWAANEGEWPLAREPSGG